jgi:micrococcal nuclease
MRNLLLIILFVPITAFANPSSAKTGYGAVSNAIFHSCYDGDTCTFTLPDLHPIIGDKIKVRIAGIDTTEIKGNCELEKKRAKIAKLKQDNILMVAKEIELRIIGRGKYFRIVADIWADGQNVDEILVRDKLEIR